MKARLIAFIKNPVLEQETRTRMRGYRAFAVLSAHLVILCLITLLVYFFFTASMRYSTAPEERRNLSKSLFGMLIGLEMMTVTFIAPALSSGAISTERERQTYDLLRVTLLSARSLVLGKYTSALTFIFLLLFTSIPLQSPAFLVGGVLAEEIILGMLIVCVTAIAFCAVGIFFSSLFPRTLISTILSYAFAIFVVVGIPVIALIIISLFNQPISDFISNFGEVSDSAKMAWTGVLWFLISIVPLGAIIGTETFILQEHNIWMLEIPGISGNGPDVLLPSPWIIYVLVYLLLSAILLWASIRLVKRVDK